jgi:DNA polymerase III delta prime subunit
MANGVLWTEAYRPSGISDYVWTDDNQKAQVESWVKDQAIPSLLISGSPGTGKTTLAKCLLKELGVDDSDVRYVNGSHTNGVDDMRSLQNFAETLPSGEYRYVLLDEADYLSMNAQAVLRNMIEEYSNVCRWILTCNYPHKIMPALHSRTQGFHIDKLDREQFATRAATILITEGIELTDESLEILDEYITVAYPDLRKCINMLQQNSVDNTLRRPSRGGGNSGGEYMVQAVALFKAGRISEARKIICANAQAEEYEDIYKLLYQNLEWWGDKPEHQDQAIVIIANRLKDHALVADPEICLAACLVELGLIG